MRTLRKTVFKLSFKACERGTMRNQAKTNWGVKVMQVDQLLQLREGAARHRASPEQLLLCTCTPSSEFREGVAEQGVL